jgi:cytochrome P450
MAIHITKKGMRATGSDANALMIAMTSTEQLLEQQKNPNHGGEEYRRMLAQAIEARKAEWIDEVYKLLCKSQGAPENETEEKNLREWASSFATEETPFFQEGMTPEQAHDEEMSCA